MKLKKWLPVLILALILVYYFLPGGTVSAPQSAPTERPADTLGLVTSAPTPDTAEETPPLPDSALSDNGHAETEETIKEVY